MLLLAIAISLGAIVNIGDEYIGSTPMGEFRKISKGSFRGMTESHTNYYYDEDIPTRLIRVESSYSNPEYHEHELKKWLYQYQELDDHREMIVSYYLDCWDAWNEGYSGYEHINESTYIYDLQDKLLEYISVSVTSGNADRTIYEYDDSGNLIQESLYRNWSEGTEPTRVITYAYDAQNRLTHKLFTDYGVRKSEVWQKWGNHSLPDSTYTWQSATVKVEKNFFDENGQRHHRQTWFKQSTATVWSRSDYSYLYVTVHQVHFPIQILKIKGWSTEAGGPFYTQDTSTVVNYTYSNDYRTVSVTPSESEIYNEMYYYNADWLLTGHEYDVDHVLYEHHHYYNTWEYYGAAFNDDPVAVPPTMVSAYPNPAKGMVNVSLSKRDAPAPVEARIYNLKGQLVRSLDISQMSSDQYLYNWDCKDQRNNAVPAGIYLIRIKTSSGEVSKKVTVLQ